jgi:hypothetical protein
VIRNSKAKFILDEEIEQYIAEITIEARELSSQATITAELGELSTTCKVVVTKEAEGPSLKIEIDDYQEAGNYRATVRQEGSVTIITIMGLHPIMKRYRGPAPNFPGKDLPTTKILIAEIVADQASRMILEKKFPTQVTGEQIDAARFYSEHYRYMTKYLTRCHKVLLSDSELEELNVTQISFLETLSMQQ